MPLAAPPIPTLPPPSGAALLLDVDGTLLDIAPTPDAVVVPPGLLDALTRLRDHLGGALAVVTGRPLEQVDALLGPVPHAVAGEHGGIIRHAPGAGPVRLALPEPPAAWLDAARRIADAHPGVLLEHKRRGFVLHYRLAPHLGPMLREAALELIRPGGDHFGLMAAHMAWEVRPRGADKGTAVLSVMAHAPFAGQGERLLGAGAVLGPWAGPERRADAVVGGGRLEHEVVVGEGDVRVRHAVVREHEAALRALLVQRADQGGDVRR